MVARRAERTIAVTVRRTGGMAGIARAWHAELPAADVPPLPQPVASDGADRFVWTITVVRGGATAVVSIAEQSLDVATTTLIDRVRADGAPLR